ncbi:hypothetical protein Tco_0105995 [Tanacetum coccineum]
MYWPDSFYHISYSPVWLLGSLAIEGETKTKGQIKLHLVRTDNVKNELVLKCEYVVRGIDKGQVQSLPISMGITIAGPQPSSNTFVVLLWQQAERVKSIVEKAERDKRSVLIDFYDETRAFLLRGLQPTSITLLACQLAFPIAVLEHKYIKLIFTGYLDSATEEAMEEFIRFEEEMEQQSNKELQGLQMPYFIEDKSGAQSDPT